MKNKTFFRSFRSIVASVAVAAILSQIVFSETWTVNDTGDGSDEDNFDGVCEVTDGTGDCTLRAAVDEVRAGAGGDTVDFTAGDKTINLGSSLPTINKDNTTIQNTGGGTVEIVGGGNVFTVGAVNNFTLDGNDDMYIYGYSVNGLQFSSTDNTIQDVVIGLDPSENANGASYGIRIFGDETLIDGATISGNIDGIRIDDTAQDIAIQDTKIGTDTTGTLDKGNSANGIEVTGTAAHNLNGDAGGIGGEGLTIGGPNAGDGNIISGNDNSGVYFSNFIGGIDGDVLIQNNKIGVDGTGDSALGNGSYGILGGFDTDGVYWDIDNNIVSDNGSGGVSTGDGQSADITNNFIGTDSDGDVVLFNTGNGIYTAAETVNIENNVVSGNSMDGINVTGDAVTVDIKGNMIGVSADGAEIDDAFFNSFENGGDGIDVNTTNPSTVTIGGSNPGDGNVISNNDGHSINLTVDVENATIQGNKIGVIDDGTGEYNDSAPNLDNFYISGDLDSVVIGGTSDDERNIIASPNGAPEGIYINAGTGTGVIDFENNYVGLGEDGSSSASTGGLTTQSSSTVDVIDNVIGNSVNHGVAIEGGTDITIQGNNIGTAADGTTAAPIANGNGIKIDSSTATNIEIGTDGDDVNDENEGNVIAATGIYPGIEIKQLSTDSTPVTIKGNYIGIGRDGETTTGLSCDAGIIAQEGTLTIGGDNDLENGDGQTHADLLGEGNVISNNTGNGIQLRLNVFPTLIYGNVIGLKKGAGGSYDQDAGNGGSGIYIENGVNDLTSLIIGAVGGSLTASKRNIISGNNNGIAVWGMPSGGSLSIKNNYIGTSIDGESAIGNTTAGIRIDDTDNITADIGGTGANEHNVVSGNGSVNILLDNNLINSTVNILGNLIGVKATGTTALSNTGAGISIESTGTVNIGNGTTGAGNVISGNDGSGITIDSAATIDILGNIVGLTYESGSGEYINAAGNGSTSPAPNFNYGGILVNSTGDVTIGGNDNTDPNTRNVISANVGQGIALVQGSDVKIQGNYIGLPSNGLFGYGVGNTQDEGDGSGILVVDAIGAVDGTIIENNIISDNEGHGINIDTTSAVGGMDFTGGYIQDNVIGLDKNNTVASNDEYGLYVYENPAGSNISNLTIGGSSNTFDSKNNYGVYLQDVEDTDLSTGDYYAIGRDNIFENPDEYTWQYAIGSDEFVHQCNDEVDNDGDGFVDDEDGGCEDEPFIESSSSGGVPSFPPLPPPPAPPQEPLPVVEEEVVEELIPREVVEEPVVEVVEEKVPSEDLGKLEVIEGQYEAAEEATKVVTDTVVEVSQDFNGMRSTDVDLAKLSDSIEEYKTTEREVREVSAELQNVADVVSGDEVNESKQREAEETVKDSVSFSMRRTLSKVESINVQTKSSEFIEVDDARNVEIILSSLYSEEELSEKEEEARGQGKTLLAVDESSDFDNDLIADLYQIQNDIYMFDSDPDNDGFSTADEIYYGFDPQVADSMPSAPRVTNLDSVTTGNQPSIRIAGGTPLQKCDIVLVQEEERSMIQHAKEKTSFASVFLADVIGSLDDFAEDLTLIAVDLVIDDSYKAEVIPKKPLEDGEYYVLASCDGEVGEAARFTVDSEIGLTTPTLELTDFRAIEGGEEIEEEEPYLIQGYADPGMAVFVSWKSIILSSVVISDASQGEFVLEVPREVPHEEVVVYAYDRRNNFISNAALLFFGP